MSWSTRFVSLKLCVWFSIFDSVSLLLRFFFFFSTKCMVSFVIIPFRIKIIEKPHTVLVPDLWLLGCNKKFKIQWYLRELELRRNWPGNKCFKLRKSNVRERCRCLGSWWIVLGLLQKLWCEWLSLVHILIGLYCLVPNIKF